MSFLMPVEAGRGGQEGEVYARSPFCCMSGSVKGIVKFWDPLQKMPPGVRSMLPKGRLAGGTPRRRERKQKGKKEGPMILFTMSPVLY